MLESDELESELDAWLSSIFVGSVDKDRTEYTMRSVKLPIAFPFPLLLDGLAADIVERGIVVIVGPAINFRSPIQEPNFCDRITCYLLSFPPHRVIRDK